MWIGRVSREDEEHCPGEGRREMSQTGGINPRSEVEGIWANESKQVWPGSVSPRGELRADTSVFSPMCARGDTIPSQAVNALCSLQLDQIKDSQKWGAGRIPGKTACYR